MNQVTPFVISEFANPSGEIVYRVSGWLDGKRLRKNFTTRIEALAERQALEVQRLQGESGVRPAVTRLSEAQLQEAEAAFHRLDGKPRSLSFYLDFALATYREPEREQPLAVAVAEYFAAKGKEQERTLISGCQLESIRKELAVLLRRFGGMTAAQLNPTQLTAYCERGRPSLKTYNNRRGILSTFFKFAFQKDWVAKNPIEKVPHHRISHRRGSAETLTAEQAEELMAFVEGHEGGRLVPFFALCLFAGIRPCVRNGEILKLPAKDVRLDVGVIHVEPEVAKTREKRMVTIQPNLAVWLCAYPLERFPIAPANLQHLRAVVATKFNLSHDVMRHTFISMFVAKFRSLGEAALQAGNSEGIIRKHYLNLKNAAEAEAFFGILPQRAAPAVLVALVVTMPHPGLASAQPAA
jgi:integrase